MSSPDDPGVLLHLQSGTAVGRGRQHLARLGDLRRDVAGNVQFQFADPAMDYRQDHDFRKYPIGRHRSVSFQTRFRHEPVFPEIRPFRSGEIHYRGSLGDAGVFGPVPSDAVHRLRRPVQALPGVHA